MGMKEILSSVLRILRLQFGRDKKICGDDAAPHWGALRGHSRDGGLRVSLSCQWSLNMHALVVTASFPHVLEVVLFACFALLIFRAERMVEMAEVESVLKSEKKWESPAKAMWTMMKPAR